MAHLLSRLVEGRCPECGHYPALSRSGAGRKDGGVTTEEWVCARCGHREWRRSLADSDTSDRPEVS